MLGVAKVTDLQKWLLPSNILIYQQILQLQIPICHALHTIE